MSSVVRTLQILDLLFDGFCIVVFVNFVKNVDLDLLSGWPRFSFATS